MQGGLLNWKILGEFELIFLCHVTLELLPFSCGELSSFEFVSALSQTSAVAGFPWSQFSVIMPDPFCSYTFQITKKSGHLAGRSGAVGCKRPVRPLARCRLRQRQDDRDTQRDTERVRQRQKERERDTQRQRHRDRAVSYTHLTLPTRLIV